VTTVFKPGRQLHPLSGRVAHGSGDCSAYEENTPAVTPFRRQGSSRLPALGETDLHAYVDGRLDCGRQSQVEAVLARNPGQRRRVEAYRAINANLRGLYDGELAPMSAGLARLARDLEGQMAQVARESRRRALLARLRQLARTGIGLLTCFGSAAPPPIGGMADRQLRPPR
jgi:anti-sigma factor RsiW